MVDRRIWRGEGLSLCGNLVKMNNSWWLDNKRLMEESKGMTDKWIWRDTKSTVDSVKTTYNHLKGLNKVVLGIFLRSFGS